MITRKERRAAEHAARKAARKAGFPIAEPQPIETPDAEQYSAPFPNPGEPFPAVLSRVEFPRGPSSTGRQPPQRPTQ